MITDDNNNSKIPTDTSPVDEVPIWNGVDKLNDTGGVSAYAKDMTEQTVVPVQDAVYNPPPLDDSVKSSVVVSGGGNGKTPVWFYVLFLIVLAVFIMTTYLLYQSFGKNKQTPSVKLPEKTTIAPSVPIPTAAPTIFREEVDAELMKLTKLNSGDEIADLESDTGNTNLNSLEDWLKDLDNKFNFTSQP